MFAPLDFQRCAHADCGAVLVSPLLQCSRCHRVSYCCKQCQIIAWKAGHKRECGQGATRSEMQAALQQDTSTSRSGAAKLRFPIGARVLCRNGTLKWVEGRVVKHYYEQPPGVVHAYQIKLGHGKLMFSQFDDDSCIQALGSRLLLSADARDLLQTLARLYDDKDWKGAVRLQSKAISLANTLKCERPHLAAEIWSTLGDCQHSLGSSIATAIELYEQSRAIAEEMGDRVEQRLVCGRIGVCNQLLGQYAKALKLHKQALAISEEMVPPNRVCVGQGCGNLGSCYSSLGQYDMAIKLHEQVRIPIKDWGFHMYCC